MRKLFLLLLFPFFHFCGQTQGEFGWAVIQGQQDILEQKLFVVTDYKMMRENLIFSPDDTIYFVYKFKSTPSSGNDFYVGLYRKSLSYVESDLKRIRYDKDSDALKTSFDKLEVGNYIIKVATDEGEQFDSVEFEVLPEEAFATGDEFDDTVEDEIIRYSKN